MKSNFAILMIDLSRCTALTEVHYGFSTSSTVDEFEKIAALSLIGDSKIIEKVSDEILISLSIVSSKAIDIALTALKFQKLSREKSNFSLMHAAMHYGKIIVKEDSLFGSSINKTARILRIAREDEILCSMEFVQMLPKDIKFTVKNRGNVQFGHLLTGTTVYSLKKTKSDDSIIDPVCKMIIASKDIKLRKIHKGTTYYFCSTDCMNLFEEETQWHIDYY